MQEVEIYDSYGEELHQLTQWDKDIFITVKATTNVFTGSGTCPVHFFNALSTRCYVVEGRYTVSNSIINITCKIPNIVLMESYDLTGHVVMIRGDEARAEYMFRISIIHKPKPSDYIAPGDDDYISVVDAIQRCETAAEQAALSESNARSYRDSASSSASSASASASNASSSALNAYASAVAADQSATEARQSATDAAGSAQDAEDSAEAVEDALRRAIPPALNLSVSDDETLYIRFNPGSLWPES